MAEKTREEFAKTYWGVYAAEGHPEEGPIAMFNQIGDAHVFAESIGCDEIILLTDVKGGFDNLPVQEAT